MSEPLHRQKIEGQTNSGKVDIVFGRRMSGFNVSRLKYIGILINFETKTGLSEGKRSYEGNEYEKEYSFHL